jgi:ketosteroid isomerase-like protein
MLKMGGLMSSRFLPFLLVASLLGAQAPTQRQEVQDFVRAYADAVNRGDVTAYTDMYSRRADLLVINDGEITRGWEALRTDANEMMGMEGSYKISLGSMDVISLGPTRAIVAFPFAITMTTAQGLQRLTAGMTLVVEKGAQGWKIIHDHTSTKAAQP